jgi:hypothetical protein
MGIVNMDFGNGIGVGQLGNSGSIKRAMIAIKN